MRILRLSVAFAFVLALVGVTPMQAQDSSGSRVYHGVAVKPVAFKDKDHDRDDRHQRRDRDDERYRGYNGWGRWGKDGDRDRDDRYRGNRNPYYNNYPYYGYDPYYGNDPYYGSGPYGGGYYGGYYGSNSYDLGYRDGLSAGRNDAIRGVRFNPGRYGRNRDSGYRSGFEAGYRAGYR